MPTIIPLPAREAHPDRDAEARARADRLSRATPEEMRAALAFLSVIDDEAFAIAFQAARPDALPEPGEPEPLCGRCGSPVALFPDQGLRWHHYRLPAGTGGEPEITDRGHQPRVEWYPPDDLPDDF